MPPSKHLPACHCLPNQYSFTAWTHAPPLPPHKINKQDLAIPSLVSLVVSTFVLTLGLSKEEDEAFEAEMKVGLTVACFFGGGCVCVCVSVCLFVCFLFLFGGGGRGKVVCLCR